MKLFCIFYKYFNDRYEKVNKMNVAGGKKITQLLVLTFLFLFILEEFLNEDLKLSN